MADSTKKDEREADTVLLIPTVKALLSLPVRRDSSALKEMDAWAIAKYIESAKAEARKPLVKAIEILNATLDDHWNSPAIHVLTGGEIKRISLAQQKCLQALKAQQEEK